MKNIYSLLNIAKTFNIHILIPCPVHMNSIKHTHTHTHTLIFVLNHVTTLGLINYTIITN